MCGIFGYLFYKKTSKLNKHIQQAFQQIKHRGRESIGYTYVNFTNNNNFEGITHKQLGSVKQFFKTNPNFSQNIDAIIGHVRYSTSMKVSTDYDILLKEAQPFHNNKFSLIHNGNIPFNVYKRLKKEYSLGKKLQTHSDTELITHLLPLLGFNNRTTTYSVFKYSSRSILFNCINK